MGERAQVTTPYADQAQVDERVFNVVYFLYFIVYFWGGYTAFNTCHTAFCGVFGRWYFNAITSNAVRESLMVAIGPSFGSIAMGSLIIAIIRAMEQLARKLQSDAQGEGNTVGQIVACILRC